MITSRLLGLLLVLWMSAGAEAADSARPVPAEVRAELGRARLLGEARLRFFGFHVYDARLWAAGGINADNWSSEPLALELSYARSLDGSQIAQRSVEEMKRQPGFDDTASTLWLSRLNALLPDVKSGDRITGVQKPGETLRFFVNGQWAGEVKDPLFTRLFTGIWLSPESSEPAMRQQLLGLPR
jgi:hypothetical protein